MHPTSFRARITTVNRSHLFAACAVMLWAVAVPVSECEASDVKIARLNFSSGGKTIRVDRFAPTASGPAILVLHGAGGTLFDGPEMRRVSRYLAGEGNTVYLIHYFNRTNTLFARDASMQRHFDEWLQTVRDGIQFARSDHRSDKVGIYGYSLGGFLALAAAAGNPSVGAVAEQAGGMWNGGRERVRRSPPVLVLHGRNDRRVPFGKYAEPLMATLHAGGVAVETEIVAGEGHVFSQTAMARVRRRVATFFAEQMHKRSRG